jgi:hypothetical protein
LPQPLPPSSRLPRPLPPPPHPLRGFDGDCRRPPATSTAFPFPFPSPLPRFAAPLPLALRRCLAPVSGLAVPYRRRGRSHRHARLW